MKCAGVAGRRLRAAGLTGELRTLSLTPRSQARSHPLSNRMNGISMVQFAFLAIASTAAKVASSSAPWWGSLLQLAGTLAGSLGGVWVGAHLVARREQLAREQKRSADALYLAVTVSGILERFTADCADVAGDDGTYRGGVAEWGLAIQVQSPSLDYASLEVVWMALPGQLLDQVHSVPRKLENIQRYLDFMGDNGDDDRYFADRQRKFAELGLHAAATSIALRTHVGLQEMIDSESSTVEWLKEKLSERIRIDKAYDEQQAALWNTLAPPASTENVQQSS
ncbi:hypothetical protein XFF6166_10005 [Xanthomonas citri pv. fuscans]|nr:Hypothetical protein CKU38_03854 [Xanthomonas citri pv. fuscans]CDF63094.1 Hypothetical protein XFF4834R_chr36690 [Xanthomonas citri pv. fuscans]SON74622.1 hypothetical protein XFF6166_10005 [Xanthomonas citri pv. fuscans]SOO02382.1 hypothetical protein XFF6960_590198 [Xanthomonas citri pv. fuscans]SOO06597.1 hypothetical protein XFF7767_80005 [Xanthomonas citri pv. fuscans]